MSERHDASKGYEQVSATFASRRNTRIGVAATRDWARSLPPHAAVLDLGCGNGVPISKALLDGGCQVHGVDALPAMVAAFQARFPGVPVICEAVECSALFDRTFDGAISWGLMFLLPVETQALVLRRISRALKSRGSLLFTSPSQVCSWSDSLTGRPSMSPGADAYVEMLRAEGLTLVRQFDDEADNHYYLSLKA